MCRSEPQIALVVIRTTTSVGDSTRGSGTSWTSTSNGRWYTTAFIVAPFRNQWVRLLPGYCGVEGRGTRLRHCQVVVDGAAAHPDRADGLTAVSQRKPAGEGDQPPVRELDVVQRLSGLCHRT